MKLPLIISVALLLITGNTFAQNAHFVNSGTIEFEKTANMFALFSRSINKDNETFLAPAFEQYKKNQPQFKKLKSNLNFTGNQTMFVPALDESTRGGFFGDDAMVNQNNTTFSDLQTGTFISQKKVFEETFILKDSIRDIHWKITDETREIAGYICRRANALILDSVYVVAFYTERIPVSGGPESFSGLPGMILGVALPHENVTWFATKVNEATVDPKEMMPPKKGKAVNRKDFLKILNGAMKDWGNYAQAALKAFSL